jgi:hypothetical protein
MFLARMPAYTKASPQVVWQTKRKISPWSMVLYLDEEEDEDMVYSEILEILDGLRRDEADQLVLKNVRLSVNRRSACHLIYIISKVVVLRFQISTIKNHIKRLLKN